MDGGFALATLNATLNGTAFVLLTFAYAAIRRRDIAAHRRLMLSAFAVSCLFLVSYLARNILYGDVRYTGEGPVRTVYFVILISHVVLALVTAPLVLVTLTLGLKSRHPRHRLFARITLPLWAYVSLTGVVVYAMLYLA